MAFLSKNPENLASTTVHVWSSFASLLKGPNHTLVPVEGYVARLTESITNLSNNSPLPIFVNILTDAPFHGSKSSIVSMAEELAMNMKSRGPLDQPEILEADLCMRRRSLLMEDW